MSVKVIALSQIPPCSHCGAREFFIERKDFQVGAYCQRCHRWIKWISKSLALELGDNFRSQPIESAKSDFETVLTEPAIRPVFTEAQQDLTTRVQRLESEIEQINRELLFYNRIFGANRGPRRVQEFGRKITDEHIGAFSRAVGDEG